jgi:hypothetical protein
VVDASIASRRRRAPASSARQSPSGTSITRKAACPRARSSRRPSGARMAASPTAARVWGFHRNQLRRWLAKHNVDARAFADKAGDSTEDSEPDPRSLDRRHRGTTLPSGGKPMRRHSVAPFMLAAIFCASCGGRLEERPAPGAGGVRGAGSSARLRPRSSRRRCRRPPRP